MQIIYTFTKSVSKSDQTNFKFYTWLSKLKAYNPNYKIPLTLSFDFIIDFLIASSVFV